MVKTLPTHLRYHRRDMLGAFIRLEQLLTHRRKSAPPFRFLQGDWRRRGMGSGSGTLVMLATDSQPQLAQPDPQRVSNLPAATLRRWVSGARCAQNLQHRQAHTQDQGAETRADGARNAVRFAEWRRPQGGSQPHSQPQRPHTDFKLPLRRRHGHQTLSPHHPLSKHTHHMHSLLSTASIPSYILD